MNNDSKRIDVIAIGRSSVDLYGQQTGCRLEDAASFAKYVGGSPANIAIGAARLGLKSALITGVGADHMGRYICEQLSREGVSCSGVKQDGARLTALAILGIRDEEQFPLLFYRENCADMALSADDIDPEFIESANAILVTGTHLSKPCPRDACLKAIRIAKEAGCKVVFDVDYRPVLWGLTGLDRGEDRFIDSVAVTKDLQAVLPDCDLIVGTEEELHILGGSTDTLAAIKNIREKSSALIVCKLGAEGCVAFEDDIPDRLTDGVFCSGFPIEVFNVLGAGDAFMSGFLRGWLRDRPLLECCRYANAAGAIVVSRHGCAPAMPTWAELSYFLENAAAGNQPLMNDEVDHIHWATNRVNDYDDLTIFAIDHRAQLEALAAEAGCSDDKLAILKTIAFKALDQVAAGQKSYGILLDGRFGKEALELAADSPYWIGRPIERPGSWPVEFEGGADVGVELNTWPRNQVVKCLVCFHPNDPEDVAKAQERQLTRLFDACRATGHELLIEIIASRHNSVDDDTTASVIRRIYQLGVRPDWWKLEPISGDTAWRNIEAAIDENDRLCRGVLILGLSASEETLVNTFASAAKFPIVKGFAVGRTIFYDASKEWLAGRISDEELTRELTRKFSVLVAEWRRARTPAPNSLG